jgi:carbon storage regulator
MLVLSRKQLEGIWIGDDIRVTVIKVERNHVRLGIEAPRHVGIVRDELEARPAQDDPTRRAGAVGV